MKEHWNLYDYIDLRGNNDIKAWSQGLEKAQRAKLNAKLDQLEKNGPDLSSGLLSDTDLSHVKKIRIKGQVAIRLTLCRGPIPNEKGYTLLFGAKEKDRKMIPRNAYKVADERRIAVKKDPFIRRCRHERISR